MECIICTGGQKCENCLMKERFAGELKDLSLGAAGRVLTLDEMAEMLLDAPKPPLNFTPKVVVDNSWAGKLQQRLAGKKSDDSVKKAKVAPCVEIKFLRRVPESPRRPPRHRRDACSMAWRCRFLTAQRGQHGHAIAEK